VRWRAVRSRRTFAPNLPISAAISFFVGTPH
jgi:hypothetical protein